MIGGVTTVQEAIQEVIDVIVNESGQGVDPAVAFKRFFQRYERSFTDHINDWAQQRAQVLKVAIQHGRVVAALKALNDDQPIDDLMFLRSCELVQEGCRLGLVGRYGEAAIMGQWCQYP